MEIRRTNSRTWNAAPRGLALLAALGIALGAAGTRADEALPAVEAAESVSSAPATSLPAPTGIMPEILLNALSLIGVPYRRGGVSPETGFDCSGFVSHVYGRTLGFALPHNARAISLIGRPVQQRELKPGDLVFYNTLRRAFSHVGIYLGDNRFMHAPASGGEVRIEDMRSAYWTRRFNGARRFPEVN